MPNIKVSPPSATSRLSTSTKKNGKNDKSDTNEEKLMVALRVRPLRQEEKAKGIQCVAEAVDNNMVILYDAQNGKDKTKNHLRKNRTNERQYVFDIAFGAESNQAEVYQKTTKPLVDSVLGGSNATVFAYGSTGSGKTHTMVGTPDNPGCMVRALNDLFEAMSTDSDYVYKLSMSYLEIYNENIRDLLNPGSGHLDLRDDSKGKNIQVAGLSEVNVQSTEEVMRLLQRGNKARTTEPTAANKTSSRSHALLMVNVKLTAKSRAQTKGALKTGRLYMIDLAGSERAAQTENRGIRLKEGAHINRSLLALGNVINALAEQKTGHVNFRDSKLTRLLKEPLSGNCQTVMIAHVSPADKSRDESRNTLVYADRAKNISNKVRKNVLDVQYHVSQYQSIITELKDEISRLKEKVQYDENQLKNAPPTASKKIQEESKELRDALVYNFNEQMKLRRSIMEIDNHILSLSMEFEKQNIVIGEWEAKKSKIMIDKKFEMRMRSSRNNSGTKNNQPKKNDDDAYKADNEESGFEDNLSASPEDEGDEMGDRPGTGVAPDIITDIMEDNDNNNGEADDTDDDSDAVNLSDDEPEDVKLAWEELVFIRKEQERYSYIRQDLQAELEQFKKNQGRLLDELPKRISSSEEVNIIQLLCKTHELEIEKAEVQSNALLQQHELMRRDILLLKYDRQKSLMNKIIKRQRALIEANKNPEKSSEGFAMPMPPELMELYELYQQELDSRTETEDKIILDINSMMRAPSVLSLRGPEFDERLHGATTDKLPPIGQDSCSSQLFRSRNNSLEDEPFSRPHTPSSAPATGRSSPLPPIDSGRSSGRRSVRSGRQSRAARSAEAVVQSSKPSVARATKKSGIPVSNHRHSKVTKLPPI